MKSLKILHLSTVKSWGGGEHQLENLCLELQELGVENRVFLGQNPTLQSRLKSLGIEHQVAPSNKNLHPSVIYRLIKMCRKNRFDLIHLHDPNSILLAIIASKIGKLPDLIFSKKTSFPIKDRPQTLYKYNYPKIKRILCVSQKSQEIIARSIKDKSKLETVYHGSRLSELQKNINLDLREKFNINKEDFLVGCIANHTRPKDLLTFVHTVNEVRKLSLEINFHFILIGNFTEETPKIKEEISRLGVEENISLAGFISNASVLIPQFDVSLITSKSEGIPQFIYESFYHRVPVVGTNVGGIPEVIENGVNGYLSPAGNPHDLARNLIALCRDKDLQLQFTQKSYEKLLQNFTTNIMASKTLAAYKKVLYGENGARNKELS